MIKITNFDVEEEEKKNGETERMGKQSKEYKGTVYPFVNACNDYDDLRKTHQGWITMDKKLISSKFDLFVFEVWFIHVSL